MASPGFFEGFQAPVTQGQIDGSAFQPGVYTGVGSFFVNFYLMALSSQERSQQRAGQSCPKYANV
jgi:hypothetical protein